jgi:hypothetical protein
MSDDFGVTDCWFESGHWVHIHNGRVEPLYDDYVTHFRATA